MYAVSNFRKTWVEVDVQRLKLNAQILRRSVFSHCKLCAVVKADAYGHGAVQAAHAFLRGGCDMLAVALAEEGILLRQHGVKAPILVLSPQNEAGIDAMAQHDLVMSVHRLKDIFFAQRAAQAAGKCLKVHLCLDTGLSRDGFVDKDALLEALAACEQSDRIAVDGVFTHFADADHPDSEWTALQVKRFEEVVPFLPEGLTVHACASIAGLTLPHMRFDMVRPGIALYGYGARDMGVMPALSWKTSVTSLRTISPGSAVSYGCTFVAQKTMQVATLAVGYGDGYARALAKCGHVLLHGIACPILGVICMDQMMVDVSAVDGVQVGDVATLLGRDGDLTITADQMAAWMDTIAYEVLMAPKARVPRMYVGVEDEAAV